MEALLFYYLCGMQKGAYLKLGLSQIKKYDSEVFRRVSVITAPK